MRADNRLSRMLHVLIHMQQTSEPMTSATIAEVLQTNPVVVRRTMAGLRDHGYVKALKGHGGGWTLAQPLSKITLLDIYNALEQPAIFAFGWQDGNPDCLVERAVNARLEQSLSEAQARLLKDFSKVTLQDILDSVGDNAVLSHLDAHR
ncbi:Rrf2 family transcriptional regulator [Massilia endophytica]|uniref:Rrf2 family transcriptional regulator n=1 Tax=Massilia endophytica TaxID=2899220 RepID=UPI001E4F5BA3|nr:Rrf2 family transcriptional regulator [Massilia endophytica]UGQ48718.1 Rrf2 family transcriptional regulator [Massilia endophytica]